MKKELIAMTFAAATPALADAPLLSRQLDGLLSGNTLYIATPDGEGPIYFAVDGRAAATPLPLRGRVARRLASGRGPLLIDWTNGPQNSCTSVRKADAKIMMTDLTTEYPRGTVSRIVPGNAQSL
ncbi:MAG: hypothetical protein MK180_09665 [Rhodobacteraceae bacterium]|nr:hypothetical protein [Paracoccaceae bacterium]